MISSIQAAQEVLDKGFYGVPASRRLDAQTANVIVTVAGKLSEKNRAHLDSLPLEKAARLCWKLVSR